MAGMTTPLSLVFAFGLFIGSIMLSTDNYLVFLSFSSFVMVFGGTMSASFISYEPRYVILSMKLIGKMMVSAKSAAASSRPKSAVSSAGPTRFRKTASLPLKPNRKKQSAATNSCVSASKWWSAVIPAMKSVISYQRPSKPHTVVIRFRFTFLKPWHRERRRSA